MARKRRKTINTALVLPAEEAVDTSLDGLGILQEEYTNTDQLPTAAYIRLSVENNGHESDDSLQTQIALVEGYIREHSELKLYDTFIDNGISGTRFDRPEFLRMMDAVKNGRVRCVVVKDLSRFGRDYLETGYYIETIFPLLNVRFIAITDHFDSTREADRNSLALPIKNLVNDMYAKDYSRKQEVFRNMCKESGRVMGTNKLYGYRFSKEKGRLEIDEDMAPYVRMLFAWLLNGVSRKEIASRMRLLGVPSPSEANIFKEDAAWTADTVTNLVYNPVYAGFHVMGKRKQSLYKGDTGTCIDRDDWLYFPDFHEPYITMDEYEQITATYRRNQKQKQDSMEMTKEAREQLPDLFPQKVWCADCNRLMTFLRGSHHRGYQNLSFAYYRCRSRKSTGKCSNKHVQGNYLQMLVADQTRNLIQLVCEKNELLKKVEAKADITNAETGRRKLLRLKAELKRIEDKLLKAYMDYAEKLLDEAEYSSVRKKLTADKEKILASIEKEEAECEELKRVISNFKQFAAHMEEYLDMKEFTKELADELIERICVYNDGERIEIVYKCQDVIENALLDAYLKGGEAE